MTTIFLVGILAAFFAVTLAAGLRRAPTWARCPKCGASTESVQLPPWLARTAPELRVRWCHACAWEGVGREGGDMVPGRPVAHGSGFRWGRERTPEDLGFRFATADTEADTAHAPPVVPAHPSGFRFSVAPETSSGVGAGGFTWRCEDEDVQPVSASAPDGAVREVGPGFRWRERPNEGAPVFRWKA